jgi:hypothetical protein
MHYNRALTHPATKIAALCAWLSKSFSPCIFRTFEIAKTGLQEGVPVDTLSKLTGLTPEEIRNLKEDK